VNTDNFFQSKVFKGIILGITGLVVFIFIFGLGVFVGTERANFSFKWAQAYHTNFGGPQGGFLDDITGRDFTAANGVFGQIIKIDGPTLTIKGKDNVEKIVLLSDRTTVVFQKKNVNLSDLKISDSVVVIGDPNDSGQIRAELIRIMPSPMKGLPANNSPI